MSFQLSLTGSGLNIERNSSYPDIANKSTTSDSTVITQITFRNKPKSVENYEIKPNIAKIKTEFTEMKKQMLSIQNQRIDGKPYIE